MTTMERFTGGRSLMMTALVVGLLGLGLTAVGALRPWATMTRVAAASRAARLSSLFGRAMTGAYK